MTTSNFRMMMTLAVLIAGSMGQVQSPDRLVQARQAYNAGQFDAAITAAADAMKTPALVNPAAVVLARAYLARYDVTNVAADLEQARMALRSVEPERLAPRDHVEFLVGVGVSIYRDPCAESCYSAAAEMFSLALARASATDDRETIFAWWAESLDRQAQYAPEGEHGGIYRRILVGAETELAAHDRSASASYWLAAAARGAGDRERAWGAAIAGWVRAGYLGKRGETLRSDLDNFVINILLPERARLQPPDTDAKLVHEQFKAQWEEIKRKYS